MRQRRFLRFLHVGKQCAGRCHCQRQVGAAEAGQVARPKLRTQGHQRGIRLKMPDRAVTPLTCGLGVPAERRGILGNQNLRRPQSLQFRLQGFLAVQLHDAEPSCGQVQPGDAEAACIVGGRVGCPSLGRAQGAHTHAGDQGVASFLEQRLVGDGAGRDHPHHLALHRALGLARFAALLTDGHGLAGANQSLQVGIQGNGRNTSHRDGSSGGRAALRQRDIEQCRCATGVVIEHFIEIAHAIEQQHLRIVGLDAQVLLHHGGVLAEIGGARHRRVEG